MEQERVNGRRTKKIQSKLSIKHPYILTQLRQILNLTGNRARELIPEQHKNFCRVKLKRERVNTTTKEQDKKANIYQTFNVPN